MNMKVLGVACLMAFALASSPRPAADYYSARQYYATWHKPAQKSYYYRTYFYKPAPTYAGYKHHYVIYFPSRPKYYYFYNPYKKVYWGRCPADHGGKPLYSLLAERDRKGNVEEIPESAFPQPAALPPLPESTDGATLDLPPDDLPPDESLPS
jgi:hypothetical protein